MTNQWQHATLSTDANHGLHTHVSPFSSAFSCSYKYLVVRIIPTGIVNSSQSLDFDDFSLTSCTASPACTFSVVTDVDGVCSKARFTPNCTLPAGFAWDFGDGDTDCTSNPATHQYDDLGTYTASLRTLTSPDGCVATSSQEVTVDCARCDGIKADFTEECLGCSPLYSINPVTYQSEFEGYTCQFQFTDASASSTGSTVTNWNWKDGKNTVLSTNQNPVLTFSANGNAGQATICLSIQDNNGCVDKLCKTLSLPCGERGSNTSQESLARGNAFSVVPNPSSGRLTISYDPALLEDGQKLTLSIFDLNGQQLKNLGVTDKSGSQHLDLGDLPDGFYTLHLAGKASKQVSKIIICR